MTTKKRQWSERFEKIQADPQFQGLLKQLSPEQQDQVLNALQDLVTQMEVQVLNPLAAAIGKTR